MEPLTVLHLVGSPTSEFYQKLSELYARGCVSAVSDPANYEFVFLHVDPEGNYRFPLNLDETAIAATVAMSFAQAVSVVEHQAIDVVLPQMFCERGVSEFRALIELLGIPYLGNRPLQMGITADKAKAKAIVADAGVCVPASQLVQRGDPCVVNFPAVVKPNRADNSDGVMLVRHRAELLASIEQAFAFSDEVLVEQYIELGREVRCGVVDTANGIQCLPLEEYFVDPVARPIRDRASKLKRSDGGALQLAAKTASESWIVSADDRIIPAVHTAAIACYKALGCRQYGLFDFRIDPDGRPWFLEAGLYCSFAPDSVIVTMMAAAGTALDSFFASAIAGAIAAAEHA